MSLLKKLKQLEYLLNEKLIPVYIEKVESTENGPGPNTTGCYIPPVSKSASALIDDIQNDVFELIDEILKNRKEDY